MASNILWTSPRLVLCSSILFLVDLSKLPSKKRGEHTMAMMIGFLMADGSNTAHYATAHIYHRFITAINHNSASLIKQPIVA
jgi:hypothetical protein